MEAYELSRRQSSSQTCAVNDMGCAVSGKTPNEKQRNNARNECLEREPIETEQAERTNREHSAKEMKEYEECSQRQIRSQP